MTYKAIMSELCQKYTELTSEDIDYLILEANRVIEEALYENADVFIDVKDVYTQDARVIFHRPPQQRDSLYHKDVVGELAYQKNEPGVLRTLHTGAITIGLSALSQEGISIQQRVYPISREKGHVIGVVIIETDVTEELDTHFMMQDKQDVFALTNALSEIEQVTISKYIQDAILLFDEYGLLKQYNPSAAKYYTEKFGYMDNLLGLHYDNLALDSYTFDEIKTAFETQKWQQEQVVEVKYGHHFFELKRAYVGNLKTLVMIFKDITDSKQNELELVSKSAAIREMNHRIKNNLQTIMSLLRLQARRSKDNTVKKALEDSMNRIFSISATHELLANETEDEVDLVKVIEKILDNIKRVWVDHSNVTVQYEAKESIFLNSNRAVAVALIVNELIQNSFDHAFVEFNQKTPKIYLQIVLKNDLIYIKASDNGKGYNVHQRHGSHLGLKIVDEFVKTKLLGKLKIHSDEKGTITTVSFKI